VHQQAVFRQVERPRRPELLQAAFPLGLPLAKLQQVLVVLQQASVVLLQASVVLQQALVFLLQVLVIPPEVQEVPKLVVNQAVNDHSHAVNSEQPVSELQQLHQCSYLVHVVVNGEILVDLHLLLPQQPKVLDSVFVLDFLLHFLPLLLLLLIPLAHQTSSASPPMWAEDHQAVLRLPPLKEPDSICVTPQMVLVLMLVLMLLDSQLHLKEN
jgi:hypothetical protein